MFQRIISTQDTLSADNVKGIVETALKTLPTLDSIKNTIIENMPSNPSITDISNAMEEVLADLELSLIHI